MTDRTKNIIEKSWAEFSEQLFGFILSKVHQREDAEDILQDVYLKSIQNIDKLAPNSNLNAWLYTVTRNSINDFFRAKGKSVGSSQIIEELFDDDNKNETTDHFCCLEPHIKELPDNYREVIMMSEINGLKHADIAEKLDLSISAIKSRVVRGRELLKDKFVSCCQYHLNEEGKLTGDPDCQRPECNHD